MDDDIKRPIARAAGLKITEMDDDTLVYNLEEYRAVSLNKSASRVWRLCDDKHDIADIADEAGLSEHDVVKTLRDLDRNGLLEPGFDSVEMSGRRNFLRAAVTGTAASVPAVLAMTLPAAAQATSCLPNGTSCGGDGEFSCEQCCNSNNGQKCTANSK